MGKKFDYLYDEEDDVAHDPAQGTKNAQKLLVLLFLLFLLFLPNLSPFEGRDVESGSIAISAIIKFIAYAVMFYAVFKMFFEAFREPKVNL